MVVQAVRDAAEEDRCEDVVDTRHEALHMVSLEEVGSAVHEAECAVLHHQVGRVEGVDEALPCEVALVQWALAQWDAALLPRVTTTTARVLMVKVLSHANNHPTATGMCHHNLLWQLDKLSRWTLVLGHRL